MTDTARLGLRRPAGADGFLISADLQDMVDTLDNAAIDQQGTLAARPAANAVARGTYYTVTDKGNRVDRSDGTSWNTIGYDTPPAARVIGGLQTIPNAGDYGVVFNTEVFDTDGIADLGTNAKRLTCQTAGIYVISGLVTLEPTPPDVTLLATNLALAVNNDRVASASIGTGGASPDAEAPVGLSVSAIIALTVGQFISLALLTSDATEVNATTSELAMALVGYIS